MLCSGRHGSSTLKKIQSIDWHSAAPLILTYNAEYIVHFWPLAQQVTKPIAIAICITCLTMAYEFSKDSSSDALSRILQQFLHLEAQQPAFQKHIEKYIDCDMTAANIDELADTLSALLGTIWNSFTKWLASQKNNWICET